MSDTQPVVPIWKYRSSSSGGWYVFMGGEHRDTNERALLVGVHAHQLEATEDSVKELCDYLNKLEAQTATLFRLLGTYKFGKAYHLAMPPDLNMFWYSW